MAVVQNIREKVHLPIFDSIRVEPEKQLQDVDEARSSPFKFFVNVQGKTKLETNLQAASLLSHYNTFEARAMRVVISDLPPEFSEEVKVTVEGEWVPVDGTADPTQDPELNTDLKRAMELLAEAREDGDGETTVSVDPTTGEEAETAVRDLTLSVDDLLAAIEELETKAPPQEQLNPENGSGTLIGKFIYNTVTSLYVGEKVMIEMPTWFFPSGAGPYSETGRFTTHGEPSPIATFRFAEPIFIDKQQNFRVEIEIPDSEVLKEFKKIYGPLYIWVVLDGYMTRDVQ